MGKTYSRTPAVLVPFTLAKGKEFYKKKLKYLTLALFQLSKPDLQSALVQISTIVTGKQAAEYAQKQSTLGKPWSYIVLDRFGHVGHLRYRGVPLRVFYRRTTVEHVINELQPIPDVQVIEEQDAWIFLDLTGVSIREAKAPSLKRISQLEVSLAAADRKAGAQEEYISSLQKKMDTTEEQVEAVERKLKVAREELGKKLRRSKAAKGGSRLPATSRKGKNEIRKKKATRLKSKQKDSKNTRGRKRKAVVRSGKAR